MCWLSVELFPFRRVAYRFLYLRLVSIGSRCWAEQLILRCHFGSDAVTQVGCAACSMLVPIFCLERSRMIRSSVLVLQVDCLRAHA